MGSSSSLKEEGGGNNRDSYGGFSCLRTCNWSHPHNTTLSPPVEHPSHVLHSQSHILLCDFDHTLPFHSFIEWNGAEKLLCYLNRELTVFLQKCILFWHACHCKRFCLVPILLDSMTSLQKLSLHLIFLFPSPLFLSVSSLIHTDAMRSNNIFEFPLQMPSNLNLLNNLCRGLNMENHIFHCKG